MQKCVNCGNPNLPTQAFCGACGASLEDAETIEGDAYIDLVVGDRYRVESALGAGGMASVYLARELESGEPCAIKFMHRRFVGDPVAQQRFEREVRLTMMLEHPNVVDVFDYGTTPNGDAYLVMEYVQGPCLTDLLETQRFPPLRAANILSQILMALEPAHVAGVVHRDLKPDNVVLRTDCLEPDRIKVLDFGIARFRHGSSRDRVTETGVICGTPEYMSPEQCRGEVLDARSDIYSAGIIFYEMLTGHAPFNAPSIAEIMDKQMFSMPPPPSQRQRAHSIPASLDAITMWALAKDPTERYSSSREFLQVLDQWVMVYGADLVDDKDVRPCPQCRRPMGTSRESVICPWCGWRPSESAEVPAVDRGMLSSATRRLSTTRRRIEMGETELAQRSRGSSGKRRPAPHTASLHVGRERRLGELDQAVTRPGFQKFRILGDNGAGKSVSAQSILALAASEGRRPIRAAEPEWGIPEPLHAIRAVATELLEMPCEPLISRDLDEAALRVGYPPGHLTALRELFGVPGTFAPMIPADYRRRARAEAWTVLVGCAARRQPVAMLFDDVERLDGASRDMVLNLAATDVAAPAILLVTQDPAAVTLWPRQHATLELSPLTLKESVALVEHLTEGALTALRIEEVAKKGGGNPLLLQELVALARAHQSLPLPMELQAALAARIAMLPLNARLTAQTAAVLGEQVTVEWLQELRSPGEKRTKESEADTIRGLEQLVEYGFMIPLGPEYRFVHASHCRAAYVSMEPELRRTMHSRAAGLLVELEAPSRALGHHFLESGQRELALPTLLSTAYQFLEALDEESAEALFRRTIAVASDWPDHEAESLHRDWARAIRGLSDTLRQLDRGDEADALREEALAQVEAVQGRCVTEQREILG